MCLLHIQGRNGHVKSPVKSKHTHIFKSGWNLGDQTYLLIVPSTNQKTTNIIAGVGSLCQICTFVHCDTKYH